MSNQFNPLELAKNSPTFCIFPWVHQYVGPPGDVKPCCVYEISDELGSLKENTLEEIWNNDKTKQMRLNFLNGIEDPSCAICNRRGEHAHKQLYNETFFDNDEEIQKIVANTNVDGSLDEHKLFYIDVRFNNLCNLSCRSCAPHYSTSWILDHQKLHNLTDEQAKEHGFRFAGKTEGQALEEIIPHLKDAKIIYFAGGEPLMQKEHYEVLKKLIEVGNTDLELRYNTNFSVLKLKNYDNVIEYWKKFPNIQLMASLDGNHAKAEYWRNGTDWNQVVDNRKRLMEECPHVHFKVSYTLSWPNAINLAEFHREWVELGYLKPNDMIPNTLDTPPYYCLKNIPDWKKREIEEVWKQHIEWLKTIDPHCGQTVALYEFAIKFMYDEKGQYHYGIDESLREFCRVTNRLDDIREQDFYYVYPEHLNIKYYIEQNKLDGPYKKSIRLDGY